MTAPDPPPADEAFVLTRDGTRFAFACPPGGEADLLARVTALAADPACPLTNYDAALLCHQLRHRFATRVTAIEAA